MARAGLGSTVPFAFRDIININKVIIMIAISQSLCDRPVTGMVMCGTSGRGDYCQVL